MVDPLWQDERFDAARWAAARGAQRGLAPSPPRVARRARRGDPSRHHRRPAASTRGSSGQPRGGLAPLRRKFYLPDEPGSWEARWFDRGDADFPEYHAGALVVRPQHLHRAVGRGDLRRLRRRAACRSSCRRARRRPPRRPSGCRWAWWRRCARAHSACRPTAWTRRAHAAASDGSSTRTETSWRGRPPTRHSRRSTSTCPPRRRRGTTIPATCSAEAEAEAGHGGDGASGPVREPLTRLRAKTRLRRPQDSISLGAPRRIHPRSAARSRRRVTMAVRKPKSPAHGTPSDTSRAVDEFMDRLEHPCKVGSRRCGG